MKILIIEDNNKKAGEILKICREYCDNESISNAINVQGAFDYMYNHKFDLVIMDMCLPDSYGAEPYKKGGLDILSMLYKDSRVKIPTQVIVLTAYEDVIEDYKNEVKGYSVDFKLYDDSSCEWQDELRAKIKYLQMYEESPPEERSYGCDVAIVTAVKNEDDAVKSLSDLWVKKNVVGDSTNYYVTEWETQSGEKLQIIRTMLPQMGMVAASTITTKLIMHFSPRYVIMPGIAGGANDEYNIGDIIIPAEVKDYCSGKYSTPPNMKEEDITNPLEYFIPSSFSINTDFDIINMAQEDYKMVLTKLKEDYSSKYEYSIPQIRLGHMACGDSVIQNNMIVKTLIKKHLRRADGIDMETYGMYYAAMQAINPKPIPICMKAISDFSDKDKSDEHQKYAAYVSAYFMKYFVENVLKW